MRQVAGLGGGRVVAALLSGLFLVVAARELPVEQFGDLALLLTLAGIFSVIADSGLPFVLTEAVAKAPSSARTALVAVVRRRLVGALAAAVITSGAYLLSASDTTALIPALMGVSLVATAVYTSHNAVFRGLGKVRVEAANDVLSRVVVLAAGSVVLVAGGGLVAVLVVYAVVDLASAALLSAAVTGATAGATDPVAPGLLDRGRTAMVNVGRVAAVIFYRVDLWLVAIVLDPTAVARYAASYRLLDGLLLVPRSVGALSIKATTDAAPAERVATLRRLGLTAAAGTLVLAAPIAVLAEPILRVVFGAEYESAAGVLAILMIAATPGAYVLVLTPVASLAQPRRYLVVAVVALAANVAVNLVALDVLGIAGAAWTTLGSSVLLAAVLHGMTARVVSPVSPR